MNRSLVVLILALIFTGVYVAFSIFRILYAIPTTHMLLNGMLYSFNLGALSVLVVLKLGRVV